MIKKVAIVEDDRGLREQLAQILGAARDVRFVGACDDDCAQAIHALRAQVVHHLQDLLARVHHEGAIARDRFAERRA